MTVCRWKGTKRGGHISCDKPISEVGSITTDDAVITCKECLLLTTKFNSKAKHIHLNADFLSYANLGDNDLLDFEKYEAERDNRKKTGFKDSYIICKSNTPNFVVPEHRITNDPKEVSCSHCLNIWGRKETKAFVLTGVLLEAGMPMKTVRSRITNATSEKLTAMLDKMLYGKKV